MKQSGGAPRSFTGEARMAFGASESVTGLFCWEATFGFALLLMDGSRFCILTTEEVPEGLLGSMVRVKGKRLTESQIAVESITPLGVRFEKREG
ncbi:MAG: hypothetical protein ACKOXK_05465 [Chakrabartia sp.]